MGKTVFVGMSGGVDSSVSAMLLKQQGYKVVGVYMKNWSRDLPGMKCPWAEDLADAKRVAVKLGIDFEVWDFEKEYFEKVVEYMLSEFKKGNTPNPDVMCNQEIKFKLFYEKAMERGADFIATGHYARVIDGKLEKAVDEKKDQTYFLYRISEEALKHTIFPIGGMIKKDVKKLAEENGLHNAYKKESMGVCFVGEVGMKDFLKEYIDIRPGEIREIETEKKVGHHEGAVFYTIGQRHGLYISGNAGEVNTGLPYYVVKKDLEKNIVYVSRNLNNSNIWVKELKLKDIIIRDYKQVFCETGLEFSSTSYAGTPAEPPLRGEPVGSVRNIRVENSNQTFTFPKTPVYNLSVRLRHLAPLVPAVLNGDTLIFEQSIKKPAAGQSAVFYDGEICCGGGIIV
ncbi:tRNA 2-thiouridine(34) synthase MnmA [Candidatus Saccharibacteria bacterium]|nr:tRNA 2-thiouridine(34) synthase MnmA [Candidatus Saccharibacteria bacterium]